MLGLISVITLLLAAFYGGWEWVLLSFLVLITLWRLEFRVGPLLATVGISFCWLAAFHWTGDRRLFFPFAMQLAVQMMYLTRASVSNPVLAGGGMVALFMFIRISQGATGMVLAVELLVANAILGIVLKLYGQSVTEFRTRAIAGMLGSVLAYAGLAL